MKKIINNILSISIIVMMMFGAFMAFDTINYNPTIFTPQVEKEVSYNPRDLRNPQTQSIQGNPEKWIILDCNEDYSIAKVLKENGHMYMMTIYSANDSTIDIEVNGQLHTFTYYK